MIFIAILNIAIPRIASAATQINHFQIYCLNVFAVLSSCLVNFTCAGYWILILTTTAAAVARREQFVLIVSHSLVIFTLEREIEKRNRNNNSFNGTSVFEVRNDIYFFTAQVSTEQVSRLHRNCVRCIYRMRIYFGAKRNSIRDVKNK